MGGIPYLSVCSIYKDQAELLPQWIEFHRLIGAERFFLYDNSSQDHHRDVLAPYLRDGLVVVHPWPGPFPSALGTAFSHCVTEHRRESRWIAFIDLDEFLFSPTLRPVAELLREYEHGPAVCPVSVPFGTSGHVQQPRGLVIENFLYREDPDVGAVKCIVDPARTEHCASANRFIYREGTAVDENHRPIDHWVIDSPSLGKLRINHYWSMSEEEAERKFQRWSEGKRPRQRRWFTRQLAMHNDVRDDAITAYVPALRNALGRLSPTA